MWGQDRSRNEHTGDCGQAILHERHRHGDRLRYRARDSRSDRRVEPGRLTLHLPLAGDQSRTLRGSAHRIRSDPRAAHHGDSGSNRRGRARATRARTVLPSLHREVRARDRVALDHPVPPSRQGDSRLCRVVARLLGSQAARKRAIGLISRSAACGTRHPS